MGKKWVFTEKYVRDKLEQYKASNKFPTFKGALLFIGLYGDELNQIRWSADEGNRAAIHIWKMLEQYKFELEVKMEEWLKYQSLHPDLENVKVFNWDNVKFLLKCSNRTYYDNGVMDAAKLLTRDNVKKQDERNVLPANTTELKLWNK